MLIVQFPRIDIKAYTPRVDEWKFIEGLFFFAFETLYPLFTSLVPLVFACERLCKRVTYLKTFAEDRAPQDPHPWQGLHLLKQITHPAYYNLIREHVDVLVALAICSLQLNCCFDRCASLQPNIIQVLILVKHCLHLAHSALNEKDMYVFSVDGRFTAYNSCLLLYLYCRPFGNPLTGTGTVAPYLSVAHQLTAVYRNSTAHSPN